MFVKWTMIQMRGPLCTRADAWKELRVQANLYGQCVDSTVHAEGLALVSTDQSEINVRATKCVEKPSRISQFIRRFPQKWQEAIHTEAAKATIRSWWYHGGRRDPGTAIDQALHWIQERVKGGLRVCDLQAVGNMPLLFRKQVYYRISQLPLEQTPLRPSSAFCYSRYVKGIFVALDFETPQAPYLQCPMHLALRYRGTNLYGLSSALATGFLAGTSGTPAACVQPT